MLKPRLAEKIVHNLCEINNILKVQATIALKNERLFLKEGGVHLLNTSSLTKQRQPYQGSHFNFDKPQLNSRYKKIPQQLSLINVIIRKKPLEVHMTRAQVSTIKKMLPCLYILFSLNIFASLSAILWLIMVLQRHHHDLLPYALTVGIIGIVALPLILYCFFTLITSFRSRLKEDHQADRKEKRKHFK